MDVGAVARLLEQTARAIYGQRGRHAIHPGQWAVLRYLAAADRDARTVGGVATHLGVTYAPASRAVTALARKNLVNVKTDPSDRRVRVLDLTAAGREILKHDPACRLVTVIDSLPEDARKEFARSLQAIHDRLPGPSLGRLKTELY